MPLRAGALLLGAAAAAGTAPPAGMPYCGAEYSPEECFEVAAGGLTFQCRAVGPANGTGVLLLHGFPNWSYFWLPLLQAWSTDPTAAGLRAVACDARGYSPKAAPDAKEEYAYDKMVGDVFSIADALGWKQFHLVGHDHGCLQGWIAAAQGAGRVLTYSGLSVPHPDVFNSALLGPDADEAQQVASNYFNQFHLADSATRNGGALSKVFGAQPGGFATPEAFQKALWWYYGDFPLYGSLPPVVDDATVEKYNATFDEGFIHAVRAAIPLPVGSGAQKNQKQCGDISMPTLFVCGVHDMALLCNRPYAAKQKDVVKASYTPVNVDCGHSVLSVGAAGGGCASAAEVAKVVGAITHLVTTHTP